MLVNVFNFLKIHLGYIFFVTKTRDSVFKLTVKKKNTTQQFFLLKISTLIELICYNCYQHLKLNSLNNNAKG